MQIFSNLFNKKKDSPKKIISFDGGGVRVIAGIVFLKKLEVESGKKITDIFDMFVGTSAGAFNASCLAFDDMSMMDLKNCLLYTSPSPRDVEESRMPSSA